MFNINDNDLIKKIIDSKTDEQCVIPLYIKIFNNTYSLLEINDIKDFSPSIFKLGFGISSSIFNHNSYISDNIQSFQNYRIFTVYDDNNQVNVNYYVFESNYVDNEDVSDTCKQINDYIELIGNHIDNNVKIKKKELINKLIKEGSIE